MPGSRPSSTGAAKSPGPRSWRPSGKKIYTECIDGRKGDEAYCRRYADGYNGERIGGSPRFYELPECESAFKFRNGDRSRGSTP